MKLKITILSLTASLSSDCFGFRAALLRRLSSGALPFLLEIRVSVSIHGPCTGVDRIVLLRSLSS